MRRYNRGKIEACVRQLRNRGFRQIIIDRVIVSIDIDASRRRRFRRFDEIDEFERTEGLDLLVAGQLAAVPAAAECADESNGGPEQIGLDYDEIDACRQCVELRVNKFKAGSQTAPIEFHGHVLCFEIGPD